MKKYSYKIYTLGCKVNQYESGELERELGALGFVQTNKNARLAIINTCCVTKTAVRKSGSMVNKAKRENKGAKIIITGCWPKIYDVSASKYAVDLVWKKGNNGKLIKEISSLINFGEGINNNRIDSIIKTKRSRYTIKIQDGCEQFCAYCIIPYTKGKLKSRNETKIIKEINSAIKSGYKEIVLTGIHLGQYGRDKSENINLLNLLRELLKIKENFRIRLSSIEINEVSDELIKLIKNSQGKICRHLHIPLQSGSNRILKLMNRPYNVAYYKNKIKKIRQVMPDIAISTDVIVGFPGETKKDFDKIYNFIKDLKFSRLHIFSFSAHEKTPAYGFPNRVKKEVVLKRAKKLRALGLKLGEEYKQKFKNQNLSVIVERASGDDCVGKTEYYFDVKFKKRQIANQLEEGKNIIKKLAKVKLCL